MNGHGSTARCVGILAALVASACVEAGEPARVEAPPDTAAGEVSFEWAGASRAAILIPVHINGEGPFDFVLDTGATLTCIDRSLADRLGLEEARGRIGFGAGIGQAGRMRLVEIDSLRVGEARAEDLIACGVDLGSVREVGVEAEGLLGLNFVQEFRLVLDFDRRVVGFHAP